MSGYQAAAAAAASLGGAAVPAIASAASPVGLVIGIGMLGKGLIALERAKAYRAEVGVWCARIDLEIAGLRGAMMRYEELTSSLNNLREIAESTLEEARRTRGREETEAAGIRLAALADALDAICDAAV